MAFVPHGFVCSSLSLVFLLEFRSSVSRRHYSLLHVVISFISSLTLVFFFTFLLPPLNFPVRDWGGRPEKKRKKVTASRPREGNLSRTTYHSGVAEFRAIACHPAIRGVQLTLNHWMTIINPPDEQEVFFVSPHPSPMRYVMCDV